MIKVWFLDDLDYVTREDDEYMAIVNPDTSQIPIWRRRPERRESPIKAWRAWDLQIERISKDNVSTRLKSVAMPTIWEGPVLRAHKRPVDPVYWDKHKVRGVAQQSETYHEELTDTFEHAGIWALKTREDILRLVSIYSSDAYGEIDLWGRVAQFTRGYRGEVGMVKRIYVLWRKVFEMFNTRNDRRATHFIEEISKSILDDLFRRYGCEVTYV